jgi:hypothetical protein
MVSVKFNKNNLRYSSWNERRSFGRPWVPLGQFFVKGGIIREPTVPLGRFFVKGGIIREP